MRHKDENKHRAIVDAAMQLIITEGFGGTSMSKIAKAAGVSPATIYVYFENKQELLDSLYLIVKKEFSHAVFDGLSDVLTVRESFRLIWKNSFRYFLDNPSKFAFHEQFIHSPLVGKVSRDEGGNYIQPIYQLFERGRADGTIPDISIQVCSAITYAPLIALIQSHHRGSFTLTEDVAMSTFEMCWMALQTPE